jgi:hypothetical protein
MCPVHSVGTTGTESRIMACTQLGGRVQVVFIVLTFKLKNLSNSCSIEMQSDFLRLLITFSTIKVCLLLLLWLVAMGRASLLFLFFGFFDELSEAFIVGVCDVAFTVEWEFKPLDAKCV